MSLTLKRKIKDIKCLGETHNIEYEGENLNILYIYLKGPDCNPWKDGKWKIRIELPEQYPYKSPSVGFVTKVWHPNICYNSGTICLDVLNTEWSPVFNLECIVNKYLPLLLQSPNPSDPLNHEAAKEYLSDINIYNEKVKNKINLHCKNN